MTEDVNVGRRNLQLLRYVKQLASDWIVSAWLQTERQPDTFTRSLRARAQKESSIPVGCSAEQTDSV
jgi:hypothetical protein